MSESTVQRPAANEPEVILEAAPATASRLVGQLETARQLIDNGDPDAAWALCDKILSTPDLPVNTGVKAALLAKEIGREEIAEAVFAAAYDKITTILNRLRDPERAILPAAEALADMEHYDMAEALCLKARELAPDNLTVAVGYTAFLVYRERQVDALKVAEDYLDQAQSAFEGAIHFAMIFNHLAVPDAARHCLTKAEKACKTKTQKAKLEFFLASDGMAKTELDQHGMAVELFDQFAKDYDKQLEKLENNGPSMIFTALEDLQLPKKKNRRVLDAGCGTGLCAGFLRPYAKELHGVDLSVKMLEIAREKGGYDFLARTDLSQIVTYPEGKFDMIVCADVLDYFGALNTVLANLNQILTPGGWLLVTVEHESDTSIPRGYKLYPSGRHKHSDDYMVKTLAGAGFPKPKLLKHARLRNEFGLPILGTLIAVQKPALMFG